MLSISAIIKTAKVIEPCICDSYAVSVIGEWAKGDGPCLIGCCVMNPDIGNAVKGEDLILKALSKRGSTTSYSTGFWGC